MTNAVVTAVALTALAVAGGCTAPHPFVNAGNQNAVEIGYGGNVESAQPLARQFCEQYDRTARLAQAGPDIAYFDCVPRR
jgi:hypothetical protein